MKNRLWSMVLQSLLFKFVVEWRGFGTEEDNLYLENVNLYNSTNSLYKNSSYYSPNALSTSIDDFQAMQEEDINFDTFDFDREMNREFLNSFPYLPQQTLPAPKPTLKKSWRDVVGTEHAHPPMLPPSELTTPTTPEEPEEPYEESKQQVKEVCRYWLNVQVKDESHVG